MIPTCPFCTSDAVVPHGKFWWCNSCTSTFDEDGEVVIEDEPPVDQMAAWMDEEDAIMGHGESDSNP